MTPPFRYRLSDREKDALLSEQAALIERQAARIVELEGLLAKPAKTSRNSHTPPRKTEIRTAAKGRTASGLASRGLRVLGRLAP